MTTLYFAPNTTIAAHIMLGRVMGQLNIPFEPFRLHAKSSLRGRTLHLYECATEADRVAITLGCPTWFFVSEDKFLDLLSK